MTPADALLRARVLEHAPDLSPDDRAAIAAVRRLAENAHEPGALDQLLAVRSLIRSSYRQLVQSRMAGGCEKNHRRAAAAFAVAICCLEFAKMAGVTDLNPLELYPIIRAMEMGDKLSALSHLSVNPPHGWVPEPV